MNVKIVKMLDEASAIVEAKCGQGSAKNSPELVAAVLQCMALQENVTLLQTSMEKMTSKLCEAAAVAAGS